VITNGSLTVATSFGFVNGRPAVNYGTLELTAANTYAGGTTVNAGTLLVNNTTGSGTGTGSVNVAGVNLSGGSFAGRLGGTGTIAGPVDVSRNATISPGNPFAANPRGRLTIANSLTMQFTGGGTYLWKLGAESTANPGVDFDVVTLTGAGGRPNLGSAARLTLDFSGMPAGTDPTTLTAFWSQPRQWTILELTAGATNPGNSNFGLITNPVWPAGVFSVAPAAGGIILSFAPVPEPAGILAAAAAAAALAGRAWARRRSAAAPAGGPGHGPVQCR
jgi:autotransporter-associated beta strand protein